MKSKYFLIIIIISLAPRQQLEKLINLSAECRHRNILFNVLLMYYVIMHNIILCVCLASNARDGRQIIIVLLIYIYMIIIIMKTGFCRRSCSFDWRDGMTTAVCNNIT